MAKTLFQIIYEDDDLVAVNKPSGMLTISDREQTVALKDILVQRYGTIFTVHRIDKDTSGLVVFAKNAETHKHLSLMFENRQVEKYYIGIVLGSPVNDTGNIEGPISEHPLHKGVMVVHRNGKPSRTTYRVLEKHNFLSLVEFQIHTGRTHQIRVHAKEIGHPLACDPLYGDGHPVKLSTFKKKYKLSKNDEEERPIINRLALHAYKLKFTDRKGTERELIAEVPKEFRALMTQLQKLDRN